VQIPRLREWRELQGWTQKDLAHESGVSARSIAGYETGASVRPRTARKLAQALDVEVVDLVATSGKGSAPPSTEPTLFNGVLEEERRLQARVVESCMEYATARADYYPRELERGRADEYATADGAFTLACLAVDEFAAFSQWLIDGPAWELLVAVDDEADIADVDAKMRAMIDHMSRTTHYLFDHADDLADTEAQRNELAALRQKDNKRDAEARSRVA
jgi:transcriptional regulator with XRE-family HTH domain